MADPFDTFDEKVRAALHSTAVPSELAMRIRGELRRQAAADLSSSVELAAPVERDFPATVRGNRAKFGSRRMWLGAAAAAGIACLAIGYRRWTAPWNRAQLAERCIESLDGLLATEPNWDALQPGHANLAVGQLLVSRMRIVAVGASRLESTSPLGKQIVIKLHAQATGKDLYLIQLATPPRVQGLMPTMQLINDSGPWSVAAMELGGQLFALLSEGDVSQYLRQNAFA